MTPVRAAAWLHAAAWLAWSGCTAASDVYRCTSPSGDVTYQSHPCIGGRQIDVNDTRSVEQQRQAEQRAKAEARAATVARPADPIKPAGATVIGSRPTLDDVPKAHPARRSARIIRKKTQSIAQAPKTVKPASKAPAGTP